jgi:dTMP kinase
MSPACLSLPAKGASNRSGPLPNLWSHLRSAEAMKKGRRGYLITFEGIDGCGKSTQVELFARHLQRLRVPHLVTREPGGTSLGEGVRKLLLPRASTGMDPRMEVLLYFASRAQNVAENILPALARGRIVLCDRFTDSSLAYQGYGRGIELAFIRELHRVGCRALTPDLTLVVDIDPRTSVQRARQRNTGARHDEGRFEQEALAFHRRVRRGYLELIRREPRRFRVIPGERSPEAIHRDIVAVTRPVLARFTRRKKRKRAR